MGFSLKAQQGQPKAAKHVTPATPAAATPEPTPSLATESTANVIESMMEQCTPAPAPSAKEIPTESEPEETGLSVLCDVSGLAKPKAEPAKPSGLGGFKFKPKAPTPVPTSATTPSRPPAEKVQDAAPQESQKVEEFPPKTLMPNEVPAEAVVRELADDASPGILKFVEMLDSVPKLFHDPDTLGQVIRNIMVSLSEEESFIQMVQPDDYKFIIRGMRDVLEGAAIKKASTKRKASPKKAKKTALDSDDLAMLDDLMSGI